jgi:hypothetical protein
MGDRFVSPCKPPEGRTRELLTILAEEAAEATQRATKALRFGIEEVQPGQPLSNSTRLAAEIGDFIAVVQLLLADGILHEREVEVAIEAKKEKIVKWLQTESAHD